MSTRCQGLDVVATASCTRCEAGGGRWELRADGAMVCWGGDAVPSRMPEKERKAMAFLGGMALVLVGYGLYRQYRPKEAKDEQ